MTSIELLKEIESWLSFNTEPSKEETAKLRKSIKDHLTEQLSIHDIVGRSEQLVICKKCGSSEMYQYAKTRDKCEDCGNIQDY